ncbi:MAG: hypothetical protein N3B14_05580 [Thermoleophilia bacterium]|nr:hypothetical protein [Thermoleophilia bacterium]
MGAFRTLLLLTAGAAVGGAVLIAYRVSQETGKPLLEAFADVPAEGKKVLCGLADRARDAFEYGRQMYQQKQEELQDQLNSWTSS